jgi:serine/threonine protein kinase/Tol biopolymer transport system component
MALTAGTRLGPYEILASLGAGGMGEVYRARDTKLNRDVALKILPELFAADADRLARFQREAQVLASLNHPHIGAIYGLEESGGARALVLELVEGPTLAERIAQGPIPLDVALSIARQIAEALQAAHEQGIIHRDLKPANIKLRLDGTVKVLDFGLAKALEPVGHRVSGAGPADTAPTLTIPAAMTRRGVVFGTAAYMSPEQARGKPLDRRTDIWAFGCVLYEMLTGREAFAGDTVSDTMAAILEREPDWSALPPAATPLASVLQRCLEKDVKRRLRDIGDVKLWLENAGTRVSATTTSPVVPARRAWRMAVAAVLGVIVGAATVALLVQSRIRTTPPLLVGRFELTSSQADPFTADPSGVNVAISPDGSRIVYTATRNGVPELVTRRLDQLEARPLTGTEGARDPFFSPDGTQIGFSTLDELRKVPAEGGPSVTICRVDPGSRGASWGPNNAIVFANGGLLRVSASGGAPETVAVPDATGGEENYAQPVILPGGQAMLYTVLLRGGRTRIVARRLAGASATTVVEGGFGPQYLASGHLAYGQGDRLMAVRFDATTLQVAGSPVAVQDGVFTKVADGVANVASAADGTTVYVSGRNAGSFRRLVWVDRRGTHVAPVVEQPLESARNPRLSPDGRRLALTVGPNGHGNIWIYDLGGAAQPLKLTFQDHNTFPIWSPDGMQIVFLTRAGSSSHMFSIPADGSAVHAERLTTGDAPELPLAWSPDGAFLLFQGQDNLWVLDMNERKAHPWLQSPSAEFGGRFSPDGRRVAYASNQTGALEVWVRPFPGPGAPIRVSSDGGHDPAWSRDGKELFYENGPRLLSAQVVSEAPDFRVAAPQVLFEGGFAHDADPLLRFFDVAPDGRLLMIEPTDIARAASIVVAQHWDEELKRLLPAK